MRLANALVGNRDGYAVFETTLVGPSLRFETNAVVAVTGAPAPIVVGDHVVDFGRAFGVAVGETLQVGRAIRGLRSYIAVAGGIDVPATLGSRSTDTLSGLGPASLAAGDVVGIGVSDGAAVGVAAPADVLASVLPVAGRPVRVLLNSSSGLFSSASVETLTSGEFVVSPRSDRVGARLTGPVIERVGDEAPTEGMVAGAIQVPPDGAPVVLLADHAVTGGYPVIAVVASADLPMVAQARPGTPLRFRAVSVAEARSAWVDAEERLASVRTSGR
jgi:biotin-dependent carboxylase-like uncharacterized protein